MESNKNYYNPHSPTSEPWDLHPSQRRMISIFLKDSGKKRGFVLSEEEIKIIKTILRANNYNYHERVLLNGIHMMYKNFVDSTFGLTPDDFKDMGYPQAEVDKMIENRKENDKIFKKGVGGYYLY